MLYLCVILLSDVHSIWFWSCFSHASLLLFVVWRVPRLLVFKVLSTGFPHFTDIVQLLCSLSGWLHLNCSSIGTGFNGAETNCRIAHNLGILLINSNCFAIYFQQHSSYACSELLMYVRININLSTCTTGSLALLAFVISGSQFFLSISTLKFLLIYVLPHMWRTKIWLL